MTKEQLKPCPFCGGAVEMVNKTSITYIDETPADIWDIRCPTKGCYLEDGADWFIERSELIEKWNRRSSAEPRDERHNIRNRCIECQTYRMRCAPKCGNCGLVF